MPILCQATSWNRITTTKNVHEAPEVRRQTKISKPIVNGNILPTRELAFAQTRPLCTSTRHTRGKVSTRKQHGTPRCMQTIVLELFSHSRYIRKPSTQKRLLLFGPVYSHRHNKPVTIIDRENFNEPIDERFWSFFTCERCRFQYLAKSWRFWFAQLERSIDVATKKTDNKLIKRHTGTYGALRHHCKLKKTQKSSHSEISLHSEKGRLESKVPFGKNDERDICARMASK